MAYQQCLAWHAEADAWLPATLQQIYPFPDGDYLIRYQYLATETTRVWLAPSQRHRLVPIGPPRMEPASQPEPAPTDPWVPPVQVPGQVSPDTACLFWAQAAGDQCWTWHYASAGEVFMGGSTMPEVLRPQTGLPPVGSQLLTLTRHSLVVEEKWVRRELASDIRSLGPLQPRQPIRAMRVPLAIPDLLGPQFVETQAVGAAMPRGGMWPPGGF